jgi:Fungal Zn(2)-Cys(6) binuclear cluster domain
LRPKGVMSTSRSTLPPRSSVDGRETDEMSASKRRKIRKGTRSCWECRQRKMKCIFAQPSDSTCARCYRRGVKCVSQEYPEEITVSLDRSLQIADRMIRVEHLVEHLLNRESMEGRATGIEGKKHDTPTSALFNSGPSPSVISSKSLEVCF